MCDEIKTVIVSKDGISKSFPIDEFVSQGRGNFDEQKFVNALIDYTERGYDVVLTE